MYSKIVNPKTGRFVKITTKLGKKILNNYAAQYGGGYVPCSKERGAKKRCRKQDKDCVYIKASDAKSKKVDTYGCYKTEKVGQGETKSDTPINKKTNSNNVALIYAIHLINYEHGDDDIVDQLEIPEYPEDLPSPCYIYNPGENHSTICYKPTWTGKSHNNGKGNIECILDISEESKNKEIQDIWKKHNQKNKQLMKKNKKLKSDWEKENLNKTKELNRVLRVGREGDIIWDLSPGNGIYFLEKNSDGDLEVISIHDEFQPSDDRFKTIQKGYWKNAKFHNSEEIEMFHQTYIMDELNYFENSYRVALDE